MINKIDNVIKISYKQQGLKSKINKIDNVIYDLHLLRSYMY